jgi:dienelactone hydrolase
LVKVAGAKPVAKPGAKTRRLFRQCLGFAPKFAKPKAVRVDRTWTRDGVDGQALSWSVGYGPRTEAWLLRPAGVDGPLPGVLALHDHGGFKYIGKEKIADGPDESPKWIGQSRGSYGNRAWANELARRGFVVLVPDVFLWGSRRFAYETIPEDSRGLAEALDKLGWLNGSHPAEVSKYNAAAGPHEHLVEKYLRVLGATLAGVISHEDRLAAAYLAGRKDVLGGGVGCAGLSGGGMRAVLLQATCDDIRATVAVGAMTTYAGLLDHNVRHHTWMLFPGDWPGFGDWTDAAACRAPSPLMAQYDADDPLYTLAGQKAAHRRLTTHYRSAGGAGKYVGRFYPGPHKFDIPMQEDAFAWLDKQLRPVGRISRGRSLR